MGEKVRGQKGSKSQWTIIGFSPDPDDENSHYVAFENHLLIELITETEQAAGVKVIHLEDSKEAATGIGGGEGEEV